LNDNIKQEEQSKSVNYKSLAIWYFLASFGFVWISFIGQKQKGDYVYEMFLLSSSYGAMEFFAGMIIVVMLALPNIVLASFIKKWRSRASLVKIAKVWFIIIFIFSLVGVVSSISNTNTYLKIQEFMGN
jgi:hypothetical protein